MAELRRDPHTLFHENMVALMTFNAPLPKALTACFKKGMFAVPNQEGFVQVSHFLLNVIYPETNAFKSCWPILDRSHERTFRSEVIEIIRGLNNDFADIFQISDVVPSSLMSPGGNRFMKIMWELSMVALGVQARRVSGDIHFLQRPPPTTSVRCLQIAKSISQTETRKNLEECEVLVTSMEDLLRRCNEVKDKSLGRMFQRNEKLSEVCSSMLKYIKESKIEEHLSSKLVDLNSEEGVSILDEIIKQKKKNLEEILKHWKDCASLAVEARQMIEAAIMQDRSTHRIVLDASCMTDKAAGDTLSDSTVSLNGNTSEFGTSLLKYICTLHDKLKPLQLVSEKCDLSASIEKWKAIHDERKALDSTLRKLEAELEKAMLDLSIHTGICGENDTSDDIKPSMTNLSTDFDAVASSTPIKHTSFSSDIGLHSSLNITPHEPPSADDYFSMKLLEVQKELAAEKQKYQQMNFKESRSSDRSIEDIVECFRKMVEIRMQKSGSNDMKIKD